MHKKKTAIRDVDCWNAHQCIIDVTMYKRYIADPRGMSLYSQCLQGGFAPVNRVDAAHWTDHPAKQQGNGPFATAEIRHTCAR